MMPALVLFAGMMFQAATPAALPPGVTIWPKGVPPKGEKARVETGSYTFAIKSRDKNGEAEIHDKNTDVMVVQTGEAVLETGGKAVDPKSIGPGEWHGTSIAGGTKRNVGPGDVIVIKAGIPHQFFVAPGTQITYVLLKVVEK